MIGWWKSGRVEGWKSGKVEWQRRREGVFSVFRGSKERSCAGGFASASGLTGFSGLGGLGALPPVVTLVLQASKTPSDSPAPKASGWVSAKRELRSSRKASSESNTGSGAVRCPVAPASRRFVQLSKIEAPKGLGRVPDSVTLWRPEPHVPSPIVRKTATLGNNFPLRHAPDVDFAPCLQACRKSLTFFSACEKVRLGIPSSFHFL